VSGTSGNQDATVAIEVKARPRSPIGQARAHRHAGDMTAARLLRSAEIKK
jgi:hypothetical protein